MPIVWMGKAETSDESRSLFCSLSCFYTCSLSFFPSAPPIILNPLYTPTTPRLMFLHTSGERSEGRLEMDLRCRDGVPTLCLLG